MKIDGACHCRNITYEAEVAPDEVEICHCTDCQTLSASAFRVVVPVPTKDFRILTGTPKNYTKTAESGRKRWMGFCPECSTQLYATDAKGESKVYNLRVGTIPSTRPAPTETSILDQVSFTVDRRHWFTAEVREGVALRWKEAGWSQH
jgi:hypothetical protein